MKYFVITKILGVSPDLKRWSIKCSIATVLIINEDLHASSDMPHGCKSRVAYVWERQGDFRIGWWKVNLGR